MGRVRALKVVLVVVGLIFCALAYPMMLFVRQEPALAMMLCVYVTLGIFLLLASRDPSKRLAVSAGVARHLCLVNCNTKPFQAFQSPFFVME